MAAALEGRLVQQQNGDKFIDLADETVVNEISIDDQTHLPCGIPSADAETPPKDPSPGMKTVDSSVGLPETCISDLMQADLYVLQSFFHGEEKREKRKFDNENVHPKT